MVRSKAVLILLLLLAPSYGRTQSVFGRIALQFSSLPKQNPTPMTIQLRSPDGFNHICTLNDKAQCVFPHLPPGQHYLIQIEQHPVTLKIPDITVEPDHTTLIAITWPESSSDQKAPPPSYRIFNPQKGLAATFNHHFLESTPHSRDIFSLLPFAPALLIDNYNLANTQRGEPVTIAAAGADPETLRWSIDGIDITDPAVPGTNPFYFNETLIEQLEVVVSDTDTTDFAGGPQIHIITPEESARLRFDGHFFWTGATIRDDNTAGVQDNLIAEIARSADVRDHRDMGGHALVPFAGGKLTAWAGYGRRTINRRVFLEQRDEGHINSFLVKLHGRFRGHTGSLFITRTNQFRKARGADITRAIATRWNQSTPAWLLAFQDTWTPSTRFEAFATLAYQKNQFDLLPRGGIHVPVLFDLATGIWEQSFYWYRSDRKRFTLKTGARLTLKRLGGIHNLEIGFEYRAGQVNSMSGYGNGMVIVNFNPRWKIGAGEVWLFRPRHARLTIDHAGAYLRDAYQRGRLGINVGVRIDRQQSGTRSVTVPANTLLGDVSTRWLPEGSAPDQTALTWTTFSPRLSLTYDLFGNGKTYLSAGFSRYPSVLGIVEANALLPTVLREIDLFWITDRNGDGLPQPNEVDPDFPLFADHRPGEPNRVLNRIDPDYGPTYTTDVIFKLHHRFTPRFQVSLTYLNRRTGDARWVIPWDPDGLITVDDLFGCWQEVGRTPPEFGNRPFFFCTVPKPDGHLFIRRAGARTRYHALDLNVTAHPWSFLQLSMGATVQTWRQKLNGPRAVLDPTGRDAFDDAAAVIVTPGIGKGEIWMNSRWTARFLMGLRLPAGFRLMTTVVGREGFVFPAVYQAFRPSNGWGSLVNVPLKRLGDDRLPDVWVVNARLTRIFPLGGLGRLEIILDVFNLLNNDVPLARDPVANHATFRKITELIEPRTYRIGLHWAF